MGDERYAAEALELSERIVAAQRPIRILDAIKWSDEARAAFFASDCREQPRVDAESYRGAPLDFDVDATREAFRQIERDVAARLGSVNLPPGSS